jgi:acyl-coenzyme A thioesterase PaaI-like protein
MSKEHDSFCFVCGKENPMGFKLEFSTDKEEVTSAVFNPSFYHQSYEDTFHGGIQSLLLDACMVQAVKRKGIDAVTAKMEITYKKQVFLDSPLNLSARITRKYGNYFFVESSIKQDGQTKTISTGVYKQRATIKVKGE